MSDDLTPIDVKKIVEAARKAAAKAHKHASQLELELVQFKTGDKSIEFNVDVTSETVWATQADIADLFAVDRTSITKHIKNIFDDKELDEKSVCANFAHTGSDGKSYDVKHYNLDMILSVGYRVNGPKATRFRQWATQTLRSYVVDGYAINEDRLRADPAATNRLAAKLREIRSDEKSIYASVREYFKIASTDYDSNSPKCRKFYATLQDKFHFAVTGETASQLILNRANSKKPAMGVQVFEGNMPTVVESQIGKNYLDRDELYTLHLLSEQFLLYIKSKAIRKKSMTMDELSTKLDELMKFNEYPVFTGYKDYLKDKAINHAKAEYAIFLVRLKREELTALPTRGERQSRG